MQLCGTMGYATYMSRMTSLYAFFTLDGCRDCARIMKFPIKLLHTGRYPESERTTDYAWAFTSTQCNLAEDQWISVSSDASKCAAIQVKGAVKRVTAVHYGAAHAIYSKFAVNG